MEKDSKHKRSEELIEMELSFIVVNSENLRNCSTAKLARTCDTIQTQTQDNELRRAGYPLGLGNIHA